MPATLEKVKQRTIKLQYSIIIFINALMFLCKITIQIGQVL